MAAARSRWGPPAGRTRRSPPPWSSPSPTASPSTWKPVSSGLPPIRPASADPASFYCPFLPGGDDVSLPGIAHMALRDTIQEALQTEFLGGTSWAGLLDKHRGHDPLAVRRLDLLARRRPPEPEAHRDRCARPRSLPRQRTEADPRRPEGGAAPRENRTRRSPGSVSRVARRAGPAAAGPARPARRPWAHPAGLSRRAGRGSGQTGRRVHGHPIPVEPHDSIARRLVRGIPSRRTGRRSGSSPARGACPPWRCAPGA